MVVIHETVKLHKGNLKIPLIFRNISPMVRFSLSTILLAWDVEPTHPSCQCRARSVKA